MKIGTAQEVQKNIVLFLGLEGGNRRGGMPPSVAFGIAPGPAGAFLVAIRASSKAELDSALGQGIYDAILKMSYDEIDVQITGVIEAAPSVQASRTRDLGIGASVGHVYCGAAGSLGFFARHKDDSVGFVSNNHVIADCDYGLEGDDVLHPAPVDGGQRPEHVVGQLAGGYPPLRQNGTVDAAFARLRDGIAYDCSRIGQSLHLSQQTMPLFQQRNVVKLGRSTGLTSGRISAFALQNLVVGYPSINRRIFFDRQIEIVSEDEDHPFSKRGDDGSLVVSPDGNPVGLLFARSGDSRFSYANPIDEVLRKLDVTLLA